MMQDTGLRWAGPCLYTSQGKQYFTKIITPNGSFAVGDGIIIKNEKAETFARLKDLYEEKGNYYFSCFKYLTSKDLPLLSGVVGFLDPCELFCTNEIVHMLATCIHSKCNILSENQFSNIVHPQSSRTYFCRWHVIPDKNVATPIEILKRKSNRYEEEKILAKSVSKNGKLYYLFSWKKRGFSFCAWLLADYLEGESIVSHYENSQGKIKFQFNLNEIRKKQAQEEQEIHVPKWRILPIMSDGTRAIDLNCEMSASSSSSSEDTSEEFYKKAHDVTNRKIKLSEAARKKTLKESDLF